MKEILKYFMFFQTLDRLQNATW